MEAPLHIRLVAVAVLALSSAALACTQSEPEGATEPAFSAETSSEARFTAPVAGIDFPTDSPVPAHLVNRKILLVADARIVVDAAARLVAPQAGVDFPTESPVPPALEGKQVLVLAPHQRVVVRLERPVAGIDFPTESPPPDGLVWAFSETNRVRVGDIARFERPVAGIDFPTESPPPDFSVVVLRSGERRAL